MLDKRTLTTNLHAMIASRLFGSLPWLADKETCITINSFLGDWGLQKDVLGAPPGTKTSTSLGQEFELDLVLVFIGIMHEWDLPSILLDYGLINEMEEDSIYDRLEDGHDPERLLRPIVRKAFRDHYNPSRLLV